VGDVELDSGESRMTAHQLHGKDFFNIPNALFRFQTPVSSPARYSFDIRWSGPVSDRSTVSDTNIGFAGTFILNQATMTWSASNGTGFKFRSDSSPTTSAFAQLGHMRNGIFFHEGDESGGD